MAFVIPSIFTAVDKFSSPVREMGRNMERFIAKSEISMRRLGSSSRNVAMETTLAGAAILAPLGLAAKAAENFEAKMSNVSTLVDTSKESMSEMGEKLLEIATRVPKPIDDFVAALYKIRSAGIGAKDAMNVLEQSGVLAVTGLGTTVQAADMITSAMTNFKKEGLSANAIADTFFKTVAGGKTTVAELIEGFGKTSLAASDIGISFRDLMAMTAAMTNTGVQTPEAQTAITQALISMNKRTKEMITIQGQLTGKKGISGMEFIKWAGSGVNAMKKIDEYATTHRLDLFKIYGRKEGALADIALTRQQYATYNKLYETMKGGNAIQEANIKQLKTEKAQRDLAINNAEILSITIGILLLPMINKLIKKGVPLLQNLVKWVKENKSLVTTVLDVVAGLGAFLLAISAIAAVVWGFSKAWLFLTAVIKAISWGSFLVQYYAFVFPAIAATIGWAVAILAIAAAIYFVVKYWNDWGAALTLLIGIVAIFFSPLIAGIALVILLVQSFSNNWDMITKAFKEGGILAGLKAIGATLLDTILFPLQQILSIIAKFTNWNWASSAAKEIEKFRSDIGIETEDPVEKSIVNNKTAQHDAVIQKLERTNNAKATLTIKDPHGRTETKSNGNGLKIITTSTFNGAGDKY